MVCSEGGQGIQGLRSPLLVPSFPPSILTMTNVATRYSNLPTMRVLGLEQDFVCSRGTNVVTKQVEHNKTKMPAHNAVLLFATKQTYPELAHITGKDPLQFFDQRTRRHNRVSAANS